MITLGSVVRDSITKFEGVAIRRIRWLYGCIHIAVQPTELKDGSPVLDELFDEQRIEVITAAGTNDGFAKLYERISDAETENLMGSVMRDTITGFQGMAIGVAEYLNGMRRYAIQPQELRDGKLIDAVWFDEGRLELLEKKEPQVSKDSTATSGCVVVRNAAPRD
jgi:hypothetical protein